MCEQIKSFEEYHKVYKESVDNPEAFWGRQAETFSWRKKWERDWEQVIYCSKQCKK